MRHQYSLTFDDFKAAQDLYLRHHARALFWFRFRHWFMPVLGVIAAAILIRDIGWHHFSLPAWAGGLLGGLVGGAFIAPLAWPLQLRRAFRLLREGTGPGGEVWFELQGDELVSGIAGRSEGRFQRAALGDFYEDDRVALVMLSRRRFLFIPKNAFPEHGFQELREWIAAKPAPSEQLP